MLRLAITGLFSAKWTDQIQQEWSRNLLQNRPELKSRLPNTIDLMNQAIPDVLVSGYEPFIELLNLPDPDGRHVLAAAIHCGAQAIVTFNLKDFPASELDPYGIEAIHPDVFIENQFDLSPSSVVATAKEARTSLLNPSNTAEQYLETLANQGLIVSSAQLREFQELI